MTKTELIKTLADSNGLTKAQVEGVLEKLVSMACEGAKKDGEFLIPGLGKLVKSQRAAREGRNPATGAKIQIAAKTVAKFRLVKAVKDALIA